MQSMGKINVEKAKIGTWRRLSTKTVVVWKETADASCKGSGELEARPG